MKECPICKSKCFDDMDVCYGCLYEFHDDCPSAEEYNQFQAMLDAAGAFDESCSVFEPEEPVVVKPTMPARFESTVAAPVCDGDFAADAYERVDVSSEVSYEDENAPFVRAYAESNMLPRGKHVAESAQGNMESWCIRIELPLAYKDAHVSVQL